MIKVVVRRVHDYTAETNRQRKEALCHSSVPDVRLEQFLKVGLNEEDNSIYGTVQRHRSNQQTDHYDIRKYGEEIGGFSRGPHTARYQSADATPHN